MVPSRLNNPNSLSLSSEERCSSPLIVFVVLLWTRSNSSTFFLCCLQSWTQDSRWGLTRAEQRGRITSVDLLATLLLMQPTIRLVFWVVSTHCQVM